MVGRREGLETDYEKLPLGHYSGRGTRQEGTGPSTPFLERGESRFETPPEAVRRESFVGRGPKGYTRPDERILDDVCLRLEEDGSVDATNIEVHVHDGVVILDGYVDSRDARDWAEELATDVPGVDDVVNRIRAER